MQVKDNWKKQLSYYKMGEIKFVICNLLSAQKHVVLGSSYVYDRQIQIKKIIMNKNYK